MSPKRLRIEKDLDYSIKMKDAHLSRIQQPACPRAPGVPRVDASPAAPAAGGMLDPRGASSMAVLQEAERKLAEQDDA